MARPGRKQSSIIDYSGVKHRGPDIIHNVRDRRYDPAHIGSWEVEPLIYDQLGEKDIGRTVIYRDVGRIEAGTIVSWRTGLVFAKYSTGDTAAGARAEGLLLAIRSITPFGTEPSVGPKGDV